MPGRTRCIWPRNRDRCSDDLARDGAPLYQKPRSFRWSSSTSASGVRMAPSCAYRNRKRYCATAPSGVHPPESPGVRRAGPTDGAAPPRVLGSVRPAHGWGRGAAAAREAAAAGAPRRWTGPTGRDMIGPRGATQVERSGENLGESPPKGLAIDRAFFQYGVHACS